MRIQKSLKSLGWLVVAICVIVPLSVQADVFIKQKNHTDGYSMMGQTQPAKDDIFSTWMGKDMARMDHGENTSIIIRMDKNLMYMINHADMEYTEIPIDSKEGIFSSALAGSDMSDEEQAEAKKMMEKFAGMMKPNVEVTETSEKKKIKDWNCRKYNMKMSIMGMTTNSEVWASEDVKIDYELYRTLAFSLMGQTPGVEDMMKEMSKIKGIVVWQEGTMSMMGSDVKSTTELLEVTEKSAPAGTYDVPEGYEKQQ
jgi:hypothetical protein